MEQPFWIDEPYPFFPYGASKPGARASILPHALLLGCQLVFLAYIAAELRFPPGGWILFGLLSLIPLTGIYLQLRRKSLTARAALVQQRAREQIGASTMGSAIHVAGHPLLDREQPVVIALRGDQLLFFSYQNRNPIDVLPIGELQDIRTVVYDDDRVPHVDVIDSTAQALQLTFTWRGHTCTSLFRRMHKVRPIDWYQAIQQARLLSVTHVNAA